MIKFEITAKEGKARTGKLVTPHGFVNTPVFLPVGTQATVKAVTPEDLKEVGSEMVLANTYHLYLRPGADTIAKLGGLHKFMHWDRPILTDSGGFQVFALGLGIEHGVGKMLPIFGGKIVLGDILDSGTKDVVPRTTFVKIEEDGPTFRSHIDGSMHFFTPEKSVEIQVKLGSDFVVALDELTSPLHDYDYTKFAMERTHGWELRSLNRFNELAPASEIFGVVQGGPFEDLRVESAKFVNEHDFFGVAIGGALVDLSTMRQILDWIYPSLDPQKPRHLFGIGTVREIFEGVARGMDMFDAVVPTRIARNGRLLVDKSYIDITKVEFREDGSPIELECNCYTCLNYSRAYVHHLFKAHELLAYRLATIHNLRYMVRLMTTIRKAISEGQFMKLAADWLLE